MTTTNKVLVGLAIVGLAYVLLKDKKPAVLPKVPAPTPSKSDTATTMSNVINNDLAALKNNRRKLQQELNLWEGKFNVATTVQARRDAATRVDVLSKLLKANQKQIDIWEGKLYARKGNVAGMRSTGINSGLGYSNENTGGYAVVYTCKDGHKTSNVNECATHGGADSVKTI